MPVCLFCPNTDLTKEHSWPRWAVQDFPKTSYTSRRSSETTGANQSWKQYNAERKIRSVCGTCNNNWMERIESRASLVLKPLIHGESPPALTADYQKRLAVWACLRAFIVESASFKDHKQYSTRNERIEFAANHREIPPANTVVWLARFPGPQFLNGDICGAKIRSAIDRNSLRLMPFSFSLSSLAMWHSKYSNGVATALESETSIHPLRPPCSDNGLIRPSKSGRLIGDEAHAFRLSFLPLRLTRCSNAFDLTRAIQHLP
jgi:hypothetical protein